MMKQNNWSTIIVAMGCVFGMSACGQNASITEGADLGSTTPAVQTQRPAPSPGPSASPSPIASPISPIAGPRGRRGPRGYRGRAGRDRCGNELFTTTFVARPLTKREIRHLVLPFRSDSETTIPVLNIGEASGTTSDGIRFVEKSEVVFAINLSLPPAASVKTLKSAALNLSVSYLRDPDSPNSEMLCLLNNRICSGYPTPLSSCKDNLNPDFWDGSKTVNTLFPDLLVQNGSSRLYDRVLYEHEDLHIDLGDLIWGSDVRSPERILYGRFHGKGIVRRPLYFAAANNTLVHSASLSVDLEYDSCAVTHSRHAKKRRKSKKASDPQESDLQGSELQ